MQSLFGVAVEQVQEVIRSQQMTRVPLAGDVVRGLMNLRGQIVMVVDLRRRLGIADFDLETEPVNVVVYTHDGPVSLLVDSIGDVIELEEATFEESPQTLSYNVRQLIRGVHKLESGLMHVLDAEKACESLERATS